MNKLTNWIKENINYLLIILFFVFAYSGLIISVEYHVNKKIKNGTCIHILEQYPLRVLKNNSEINGGGVFFLGIGGFNINEKQKYYFYKQVGNGYILDSVVADKYVLIIEDEEKQPYMVIKQDYCYSNTRTTEFHIPKNSIMQNYKLN